MTFLMDSYHLTGLLDPGLTVSASTLGNWMTAHFGDTAVCPHKSDYCPSCFEFTTSLESLQVTMNLNKVKCLKKNSVYTSGVFISNSKSIH
jgi:hypothetical protein